MGKWRREGGGEDRRKRDVSAAWLLTRSAIETERRGERETCHSGSCCTSPLLFFFQAGMKGGSPIGNSDQVGTQAWKEEAEQCSRQAGRQQASRPTTVGKKWKKKKRRRRRNNYCLEGERRPLPPSFLSSPTTTHSEREARTKGGERGEAAAARKKRRRNAIDSCVSWVWMKIGRRRKGRRERSGRKEEEEGKEEPMGSFSSLPFPPPLLLR